MSEEHGKAVNQNQARHWLRRYRHSGGGVSRYGYPLSETPRWIDWLDVEGDAFIVSDVEVPDHDATTLDRATQVGQHLGINRLVVAGDFLAHDQFYFYPDTWLPPEQRNYLHEIIVADKILKAALQWFDEVIVITGNHDERVA